MALDIRSKFLTLHLFVKLVLLDCSTSTSSSSDVYKFFRLCCLRKMNSFAGRFDCVSRRANAHVRFAACMAVSSRTGRRFIYFHFFLYGVLWDGVLGIGGEFKRVLSVCDSMWREEVLLGRERSCWTLVDGHYR